MRKLKVIDWVIEKWQTAGEKWGKSIKLNDYDVDVGEPREMSWIKNSVNVKFSYENDSKDAKQI
jgi:hypothetical protein